MRVRQEVKVGSINMLKISSAHRIDKVVSVLELRSCDIREYGYVKGLS